VLHRTLSRPSVATNEHMRRINHSLGFTDRITTVDLSARVADL
jgi:hypothetical protein